MRPIPKNLRDDMAADPWYKKCCITGRRSPAVKIEWHHNLIFAGRQHNAKWCILPLSEETHSKVSDPKIKSRLDWIMLNRATDTEIREVSKAVDYLAMKQRLNKIYGIYRQS